MSIIPFDDRDGYIWLNGEMMPWRECKTHVISHGLHYASLVFEGERAYNGKIFKSKDHTNRLFNSAKILAFSIFGHVLTLNLFLDKYCFNNSLNLSSSSITRICIWYFFFPNVCVIYLCTNYELFLDT